MIVLTPLDRSEIRLLLNDIRQNHPEKKELYKGLVDLKKLLQRHEFYEDLKIIRDLEKELNVSVEE